MGDLLGCTLTTNNLRSLKFEIWNRRKSCAWTMITSKVNACNIWINVGLEGRQLAIKTKFVSTDPNDESETNWNNIRSLRTVRFITQQKAQKETKTGLLFLWWSAQSKYKIEQQNHSIKTNAQWFNNKDHTNSTKNTPSKKRFGWRNNVTRYAFSQGITLPFGFKKLPASQKDKKPFSKGP